MIAKRKLASGESDEQTRLVERLYRLTAGRISEGKLRVSEPPPLSRDERAALEDYVFVCRRLSDREPMMEGLRGLSARFSRIVLEQESKQ